MTRLIAGGGECERSVLRAMAGSNRDISFPAIPPPEILQKRYGHLSVNLFVPTFRFTDFCTTFVVEIRMFHEKTRNIAFS